MRYFLARSCARPIALLLFLTAAPVAAQQSETQPAPGWAVQCSSPSRAKEPQCAMEQKIVLEGSGQFLARMVITQHGAGQNPVMLLHVPLGMSIPAGLTLRVDGMDEPVQLEYQTCDAGGCYAGQPVPAPLLAALIKGMEATLKFESSARQPIELKFSLSGFTEAYEAIR
ncbi:invasion associated locus B family protein [Pseudohoeflea coraliihabitans]|uniref:Invasion associated locus B family protein n=1 Tax=Pseudohoeflea coraliihabitans TaxID=2860393 RepID=A0ABS6WRT2_9HYPH|nr:invasion associated locus B family protein [Pseudohoeflea sp. DP4N28-3]MBW3098358.1 invasion associated locus B family protein [Pseudohoeflea sp. DP4N28-3]